MRVGTATVRAVNGLTARWAATAGDGGTVFSAAGVWPLLGFLADGAAGPARAELAEALGLPADRAADAARELLAGLGATRGLDSAVGLWTRRTLELREAWSAGLPADAHGVLTGDEATDRRALDAWAKARTGGLIERMPVASTANVGLVLANALALRTRWLSPFDEVALDTAYEPWAITQRQGLWRRSAVLDRIGVAATPHGHVTELKVLGDNALDVHLLLGEEGMTPGQVLGAGVGVLAGAHPVVSGPLLPHGEAGPGLTVCRGRSTTPDRPLLDVTTVAYDMTARHDLLALHRLFGLTTARDDSRGHFPGVSASPLAVGAAEQAAMARFGALGFRAAAVTAFAAVPGGMPPPVRYLTTTVEARFDRPFGFLALERHSRLVLAAGWVTDPLPLREEPWEDGTAGGHGE
ncbi:serpin family protein [Streptomyces sp. L2]|uniref:serpin family protein n=1 Tax=Streptomyces sp. L2 TaxID=2162665 RepID=UPI0010123C7F|nr:serpin family protein [Streptomyces sp. L2]